MQGRAREEVEAADEALRRLIIDCAAVLMPDEGAPAAPEGQPAKLAAPESRSLAA
jgi:hypothetical protein